jgi:hypothetical protein
MPPRIARVDRQIRIVRSLKIRSQAGRACTLTAYAKPEIGAFYLDEFVLRFNRRRTRHATFRSLLGIAAGHASLTYKMLIAPEAKP